MSSLTSPAKARVQRTAIAAVERARLSLVPVRRARAPRAPFAVLVLAVLAAGVVGLLMFNTHMQQASFYATSLQQQADDLTAQRQKLDMELESMRDPQRLAVAGRELGLVAPSVPAFISLRTGQILGIPTAATPEDGVKVVPLPAALPRPLRPKPITVDVIAPLPPKTATTNTGNTRGNGNGPASTNGKPPTGTNGTAPANPGAAR
jgi:hypothetical protein